MTPKEPTPEMRARAVKAAETFWRAGSIGLADHLIAFASAALAQAQAEERERAIEIVRVWLPPAAFEHVIRAIREGQPAPQGVAAAPREAGQGEALPMVLHCPKCGLQHIDAPEPEIGWTNPPHKSHLCHGCHSVWRPADVPTTGVQAIRKRGERDTWPDADGIYRSPPPAEPSSAGAAGQEEGLREALRVLTVEVKASKGNERRHSGKEARYHRGATTAYEHARRLIEQALAGQPSAAAPVGSPPLEPDFARTHAETFREAQVQFASAAAPVGAAAPAASSIPEKPSPSPAPAVCFRCDGCGQINMDEDEGPIDCPVCVAPPMPSWPGAPESGKPPTPARFCENDVCDASKADGVVCAEDECDIREGLRAAPPECGLPVGPFGAADCGKPLPCPAHPAPAHPQEDATARIAEAHCSVCGRSKCASLGYARKGDPRERTEAWCNHWRLGYLIQKHRADAAEQSASAPLRASLATAQREAQEAREVVRDLVAVVRGECPSLLNDDSTTVAALDARIDTILATSAPLSTEGAQQQTKGAK